jgi:hypothetical protein
MRVNQKATYSLCEKVNQLVNKVCNSDYQVDTTKSAKQTLIHLVETCAILEIDLTKSEIKTRFSSPVFNDEYGWEI